MQILHLVETLLTGDVNEEPEMDTNQEEGARATQLENEGAEIYEEDHTAIRKYPCDGNEWTYTIQKSPPFNMSTSFRPTRARLDLVVFLTDGCSDDFLSQESQRLIVRVAVLADARRQDVEVLQIRDTLGRQALLVEHVRHQGQALHVCALLHQKGLLLER